MKMRTWSLSISRRLDSASSQRVQSGTLVNGLMYRYQELSDVNGPVRPGIVHRLDRDTSGLILIAKTNVAHARLGRQFEKHTIIKRYVARVQGKVQFDQASLTYPWSSIRNTTISGR